MKARFSGRRYISLESYKKNGEPKRTPVQSIEKEGKIYVRTGPQTWKVKRIRRNPDVRVALSDRSGNPVGDWVRGQARILEGQESEQAMKFFREEYGAVGNALVNFVGRLRGERLTTVITISLKNEIRD